MATNSTTKKPAARAAEHDSIKTPMTGHHPGCSDGEDVVRLNHDAGV
ncbi:hypothetical protein ACWGET_20435 [Streptomyces zaomyceticus]